MKMEVFNSIDDEVKRLKENKTSILQLYSIVDKESCSSEFCLYGFDIRDFSVAFNSDRFKSFLQDECIRIDERVIELEELKEVDI